MAQNRIVFLVVFWIASVSLSAQSKDRYMVFFTDKDNTPFSVSEPLEFLSQRSLDRREKHGVSVITEDLPVDPDYVADLENAGADVYFTSRWMNAALVQMSSEVATAVSQLASVETIEMIAPGASLSNNKNPITKPTTFTNPSPTGYSTDIQLEMLGADDMITNGHDGDGVLLAVFDGGFHNVNKYSVFQHLYGNDRIVAELDFVANTDNPYDKGSDHGTQVLSCIAANYGADLKGTAPNVSVILAVTEQVETEYRVEEYNWLLAAEYADSAGVDIINSSLGYIDFDNPEMDYQYDDMDGLTAVVSRAANFAYDRGILVVNSAGNSGSSNLNDCETSWCYIGAPADSEKVLSVGSVNADGVTRTSFSSIGPSFDGRIKPDVMAMGFATIVVKSSGNIEPTYGTSFSSPLMAGFAASLLEAFPELTNQELMNAIRNSGSRASNPNNQLGYGVPSYILILTSLSDALGLPSFEQVKVFPNPMESSINIENAPSDVQYSLIDVEGRRVQSGILTIGETEVSLGPHIKSGIYFLQLQSKDFSETIKLLKK